MSIKRILLCNDDGFDAVGVCALEKVLAEIGETWKITPDRQRSGSSHAMNFHETVSLTQVSEKNYILKNGYPADCANVGLHADGFPKFDLVVSGINHGPNLGDDVHYSGTIAAARQGAIHHIRSVAISAVDGQTALPSQMLRIAKWLKIWLTENFHNLRTRITYNINYPQEDSKVQAESPYPSVLFSYQGQRNYQDRYIEVKQAGKERVLQLAPTELQHVSSRQSDFEAVLAKNISITPLSTYTTHIEELHRWS